MSGGRPSKYNPEFCEIVESEMAKGHSVTACAATIGVTKSTIYEWKKVHKEFSDAISRGYSLGLKYFEELLIGKMNGSKRNVDTSCLIFALKTRFHKEYGEIQKLDHSGEIKVNQIDVDSDDSGL